MITRMAYDPDVKELYVAFPVRGQEGKTEEYTYRNVAPAIQKELAAEIDLPKGSIGKLFISLVKSKATKLSDRIFTL